MNPVHKALGRVCENCPLCNRARNNPDGALYKLWSSPLHGSWCPSWNGYKKLEEAGQLQTQQAERG